MHHHLAVRQSNLGLADATKTLPVQIHGANCKVWWKRNSGLGLFFMVWLGPLVAMKGILNASVYNDIQDDSVFPTLWQQFGEGPFLFRHESAPMHIDRSLQLVCRDRGGRT